MLTCRTPHPILPPAVQTQRGGEVHAGKKVFVSYSRGAEGPAKEGLEEIINALTVRDFQRGLVTNQPRCLLIDDAIAHGELWRERLYECLRMSAWRNTLLPS